MRLLALISLAVVLMTAGPAFAQSSGETGYTRPGEGSTVQPSQKGPSDSGGSLPFSGQDLIVLAGVGGVLVVIGLALGRLTKHPSRQTSPRSHS